MHSYMKKNERKRIVKMRIMTILSAFSIAICIFLISGNHMHSHEAQASAAHSVEKVYQSVRVNAGDTLWSIADSYMTEYDTNRSGYMKEIKEINHITEKDLQAGAYIIVPTYIEAEKSGD